MATKRLLKAILEREHHLDIAKELAELLKNQKKFYKKYYKAAKMVILDIPIPEDMQLEGRFKDQETVTIKVPMITAEMDKSFQRYKQTLELAMKYTYPTMKGMEVKTDETGQIAFNITIPEQPKVSKKGK